jgi:hypothetical protein
MEIFYLHTPKTLGLAGKKKSSNLAERLRTGANVLVKLIYVFEVILSARGVVRIVRFLVRRVSCLAV